MKCEWQSWIVRPGLASLTMGAAVYLLKKILPAGRISTVLCVIAGVAFFFIAAYLLKAITKEDIGAMTRRRKKA